MEVFLNPSSVLLIGVSRKTGPGSYNNLETLKLYGYKGKIFVVHPVEKEILGIPAYKTVGDCPEVPDVAVISVGRDRVLPLVKDCVERGIKRIVIISQGFADADHRGKELQEEIVRIAKEGGARVIGPNTMGIVNHFSGFTTAFIDLKRLDNPPPLGLIAQSGVFQVGYEAFTGPYGKAVDIGNACDVDFVDVLEYFERDPQIKVIAIHMEGLKNGRRFLKVASRVASRKPIVILKTGRSSAGARIALSHTGSMVGDSEIFDVAFERAGLVRAKNMLEFRSIVRAFLKFKPLNNPFISVITATGACGIMTADGCEDYGLSLSPFPEKAREKLENPKISWHRLSNPVDVWPLGMVSGSFGSVLRESAIEMLKHEETEAILLIVPVLSSPLHQDLDIIKIVEEIRAYNVLGKPIVLWPYGDKALRIREEIESISDVEAFGSIDEALMGLAGLWRYKKLWSVKRSEIGDFPEKPAGERRLMSAEEFFSLLERYGISCAPFRVAQSVDEALEFSGSLGYPVVLKIISSSWVHKSDLGGVITNIGDDKKLVESFESLKKLFSTRTPQAVLDGIMVQKQVDGVEVIVGFKRDEVFGPVVMVGAGGIFTEIMRDISLGLAPLSEEEAEEMLKKLRIFKILSGARGKPSGDIRGLCKLVSLISRVAIENPNILELDLNPVMVREREVLVVDGRAVAE